MIITTISQSEQTLIRLTEARDYLQIRHNQQDGVIQGLIDSAIDLGETWLWYSLRDKTLMTTFFNADEIWLPGGPVTEITKMEYYSDGWTETDDGYYEPADINDYLKVKYKNIRFTYTAKAYQNADVVNILKEVIHEKFDNRPGDTNKVNGLLNQLKKYRKLRAI